MTHKFRTGSNDLNMLCEAFVVSTNWSSQFSSYPSGLNENLQPFVDFVKIQTNVPILNTDIFEKKQDLIMLYVLCHARLPRPIEMQWLPIQET